MSQENVETVQRVHDALTRRDSGSVLALYDPEIEMDFSNSPFADFIQQGRIRRHEGLRRAFRAWYDAWEEVEADLDELIDAGGDQVISVFTYKGRGRVTRVEVEWKHMAGVWTIREGKVVRVDWLRTRDQALEAVGLRE
jgi:ketosteroid isomerase-like protein